MTGASGVDATTARARTRADTEHISASDAPVTSLGYLLCCVGSIVVRAQRRSDEAVVCNSTRGVAGEVRVEERGSTHVLVLGAGFRDAYSLRYHSENAYSALACFVDGSQLECVTPVHSVGE